MAVHPDVIELGDKVATALAAEAERYGDSEGWVRPKGGIYKLVGGVVGRSPERARTLVERLCAAGLIERKTETSMSYRVARGENALTAPVVAPSTVPSDTRDTELEAAQAEIAELRALTADLAMILLDHRLGHELKSRIPQFDQLTQNAIMRRMLNIQPE